jgi:phosphate transport system protein
VEIKLESYLKDLKADLLKMGGSVEKAIQLSTQALEHQKELSLDAINEEERKINQAHMSLDEDAFKLIARQAPKASDLRLILAILKANNDLERMGDLARNIGLGVRDLVTHGRLVYKEELTQLCEHVRIIVRKSLDSMTRADEDLAREVLNEDTAIDRLKDDISAKLRKVMKESPEKVDLAVDLLLITRNLERISDHATNIAEEVVFILSGKDIRHNPKMKSNRSLSE